MAAEATYLTLLRAGLFPAPVPVEGPGGSTGSATVPTGTLNQAWTIAKKQATRGVVGKVMLDSGVLPPEAENAVKKKLLAIAAQNLRLEKVLARSVSALEAEGIGSVLLKGQGAAACYPDPYSRESGDIDLYTGPENARRAFQTLSKLPDAVKDEEYSDEGKHSHLTIDGIPVEIHRLSDSLPPKWDCKYQEIAAECLSKDYEPIVFDGVTVNTPEPTFNALFLFNHLWRHFFTEGVGFRQVCDWTLFLHRNAGRIDRGRLKGYLDRLSLLRPWQVFGAIATQTLGLPEDEMPFFEPKYNGPKYRKKTEKVVRMMLREGNFGHERNEWYELSRESVTGLIKVFISISRRYLGLVPVFGRVMLYEYIARIRKRMSR